MFEYVPILRGAYLTYSQYMGILLCFAAFVIGLLFYLFTFTLKHLGNLPPPSIRVFFISLFRCQSITWITISLLVLSATSLVATWKICIMIVAFLASQFRKYPKPSITCTLLFVLLSTIVGILLPLALDDTCICLNEANYSQSYDLSFLNLDATFNTRFTRLYQLPDPCPHPDLPCQAYITLPRNSSHEAFLNLHTHISVKSHLRVHFKARAVESQVFCLVELEAKGQRCIHTFHLTELPGDQTVALQISINKATTTYHYRAPASSSSLRIIAGGDVGNSPSAKEMWQRITQFDPDVILIGGDIAYDNAVPACYWTWDLFLNQLGLLQQRLKRLVPVVYGVGNHDLGVNPNALRQPDKEALYFKYFPQHLSKNGQVPKVDERMTYFLHEFAAKVQIFTLDSGYQSGYEEQSKWMRQEARSASRKLGQYHNPLFSGCVYEDFERFYLGEGTKYWVSVFDELGFESVYENHKHTFKKTLRLKKGKASDTGTLYLGDGAWGAQINHCEQSDEPFIDMFQLKHSVWLTVIHKNQINHYAIKID